MSVTIGGTFSGLNVNSIIQAVIAADSIPITNLQSTNTALSNNSSDLGSLGASLGNLSAALQKLGSSSLFTAQTATSSTPTVGSAAVSGTATSGSFGINVTQLASSTVLRGGSGADTKLTTPPAGSTAMGTVLGESTVAGQTFTLNGKIITLADADTLDGVIAKINGSGAGVTASYDAGTGHVSLSSGAPIILGSGADSSDFLKQAGLYNNGTGSVSSVTGLGRINPTADLSTAGLRTTPVPGNFTINGVSISYNAGDSLNAVVGAINASGAGVTAIYDTYQDQVVLSSSTRGPQNITVADGTSNLASALRLTSGDSTLILGQPTLFTVNGSTSVRQSTSNVIDSGTLGVPGVTFTATSTGTTQVSVAPDVTTVAGAINAFVDQYNSTQSVVNGYTAVNTSDTSKNGSLATDTNLTFLAPQLRHTTAGSVSATATIRMLSDLGINTNANDNTLTHVDSAKLQAALTNHLGEVQSLFNDPTSGLTNTVQSVIATYNDSLSGVLTSEQKVISQQIQFNKDRIAQLKGQIAAEQTLLQNEFATLDSVESKLSNVSSILGGSSSGTNAASVGGTTTTTG